MYYAYVLWCMRKFDKDTLIWSNKISLACLASYKILWRNKIRSFHQKVSLFSTLLVEKFVLKNPIIKFDLFLFYLPANFNVQKMRLLEKTEILRIFICIERVGGHSLIIQEPLH